MCKTKLKKHSFISFDVHYIYARVLKDYIYMHIYNLTLIIQNIHFVCLLFFNSIGIEKK